MTIVGLAVAVVATAGQASIPVGFAGAATVGELTVAGVGVAGAAAGGAVIGNGASI